MLGPILWPLMNTTNTKHDTVYNKSRGTTAFDFGPSGTMNYE